MEDAIVTTFAGDTTMLAVDETIEEATEKWATKQIKFNKSKSIRVNFTCKIKDCLISPSDYLYFLNKKTKRNAHTKFLENKVKANNYL